MWELETTGSRRRTVITGAKSPDGTHISVGDVVKLESPHAEFGIIASFRQEPTAWGGDAALEGQVRLLLLLDPEHINVEPESANEILATSILRWVPLDHVSGRVELGSAESGKCYVRRAADAQFRIAGPVEVRPDRDEVESIASHIASVFRASFPTPRRGRKPQNPGIDMMPRTLFPRAKQPKEHTSALVYDASSETSEFESDSSEASLTSNQQGDIASSSSSSSEIELEIESENEKESFNESPASGTPRRGRKRGTKPTQSPRKKTKSQPSTPLKALRQRHDIGSARPADGGEPKALPKSPQKVRVSQMSPYVLAQEKLHVSSVPEALPCRERQFTQIFVALQDAVATQTGTCIYISGTPGTGKTATVREAISQLQVRQEDGQLSHFTFLEINGMRLPHPNTAYEILWSEISGAKQGVVNANTAMASIEAEFKKNSSARSPVIVLLDELDQMTTKSQSVLYNFFNWPSLPHSKLIVVAIAPTVDLTERMLSNKIASRLGLTRISFKGYTFSELREIIMSRLDGLEVVDTDAVEYVARRVAGVSGDVRRALDICRRAFELGGEKTLSMELVREAIAETQAPPLADYIVSLSVASKVLLCAILSRSRLTGGETEMILNQVLHQAEQLVQLGPPELSRELCSDTSPRLLGFQTAVTELAEAGVIAQQSSAGETTRRIRIIAPSMVKKSLEADPECAGLL